MKTRSILFLLMIASLSALGQKKKFYSGTLFYSDGQQQKALIKPPSDAADKTIDYKLSEDGKKESVKSEQLKSFTLLDGKNEGDFVRTEYFEMGGKKRNKHGGWFNVLRTGDVTLYSNNYDNFSSREVMNPANSHNIIFLLKRPQEEVPTVVGLYFPSMVNHNQLFRKHTATYFSDYPELANRLKGKEFKLEDIASVVEIYNSRKK